MQFPAMYEILTEMLENLTDLIDSQAKKSKNVSNIIGAIWGKLSFWAFWGKNTLDYGTKKLKKMLDIIGAICERKNTFWAFGGEGHISRYFVDRL